MKISVASIRIKLKLKKLETVLSGRKNMSSSPRYRALVDLIPGL